MPGSSYIFGSGPSILDLSDEEKDYLNNHPNTLGMNRYLMHWDMVGVLPKAMILADTQFPSSVVMAETVQAAQRLPSPVSLYFNKYFRVYLSKAPWQMAWGTQRRLRHWRRYKYWIPVFKSPSPTHFFTHTKLRDTNDGIDWASTIDEPLYWYRGSLTTAINLASIIYPGTDIKLLGIDLDSFDPFYQDEDRKHPTLKKWMVKNEHDARAERLNRSTTVIPDRNGFPGVLSAIPLVKEQLESRGSRLLCCNPNSLLVKEGVCEYAPVRDSE